MTSSMRFLGLGLLMVQVCNLSSCGGGGGSKGSPALVKVSVTVSPMSASVQANGGTQQFTASVANSSNAAVEWRVNQVAGGSATSGTITSAGLYAAPATLPSPATVTVTAVSQADASASGNATISITPAPVTVVVAPVSVNLAAAAQAQFTASVANSSDTGVTWQVNGVLGGNATVGTISASGLYTAPMSAASVSVTAVSQANPGKSGYGAVTVLAPHAIGTRETASNFAEFYDRESGSVFLPRGNNLIRLATQTNFLGWSMNYHSTFNAGLYDSARAETALNSMQVSGYNMVRVWINGCCDGSVGKATGGLNANYINNLADFLERSRQHGIYVILTTDWVPDTPDYLGQYSTCDSRLDGYNRVAFCPAAIDSYVAFFQDVVQALVTKGAALDSIFAYELRNEYYYDSDKFPLNAYSGMFAAADGVTYDLSASGSHQRMMDNALVYFTNRVTAGIKAVDPSALVTVGFFWPQTPNSTRVGDMRVISVYPAMSTSDADFIDIHGYAIPFDLTVPLLMQNYAITAQDKKPVIMGEFGAFKSDYYMITTAAQVLKNWQIATCTYNIKGWLLWTWDTEEPEQMPALWPALSGDGSINQALSPAMRPDPCQ